MALHMWGARLPATIHGAANHFPSSARWSRASPSRKSDVVPKRNMLACASRSYVVPLEPISSDSGSPATLSRAAVHYGCHALASVLQSRADRIAVEHEATNLVDGISSLARIASGHQDAWPRLLSLQHASSWPPASGRKLGRVGRSIGAYADARPAKWGRTAPRKIS
jgi:hypothetical protein